MRKTFFDKDPLANDIDKYDDPRYAPIEDDFVEQDKIESSIDHHRAEVVAAFFRLVEIPNLDPSYLAEREREDEITLADWAWYRERRAAKDAEVYF